MTRVVFDCMVFLQAAARSTGPSAACLQAVRDGRFQLLIHPEILAEVRDVLTRPKTFRKFPTLTVEAVDVFVRSIVELAVMVFDAPSVIVLERDPRTSLISTSPSLPGRTIWRHGIKTSSI